MDVVNSFFVFGCVSSGWNGGGENMGMSARGSPTMLQFMRNFSGKSARMGRTFWTMGLYFFTTKVLACHSSSSVGKIGLKSVVK